MIRRTALPFHNQETVLLDRTPSLPKHSAIKPKTFDIMNRYRQMNANLPTLHFHLGDTRKPLLRGRTCSIRPKSAITENFHENRDDDNTGRLMDCSSSSNTKNGMTITARTYPTAEKKQLAATNNDQFGGVFESCSEKFEYVLPTVSYDSHDPIFFPLNDLETDLDIIANPDQELTVAVGAHSSRIENMRNDPMASPSSLSMRMNASSCTSRNVDSTCPTHPYLKLKKEPSNESNTAWIPNPNAGPSPPLENESASTVASLTTKLSASGCSRKNASHVSCVKSETRNEPAASLTRHKHWTGTEDNILRDAIAKQGRRKIQWETISEKYFLNARTAAQCKVRWNNHVQPGIVRGKWDPHEDQIIIQMVSDGYSWKAISKCLPGRTNESVRYRFVNTLDPNLKKTPWTKNEDEILFETQRIVGNKWSKIGRLLPGRSDNAVKNRYYNKKNAFLRKIRECKRTKTEQKRFQFLSTESLRKGSFSEIGKLESQSSDNLQDTCTTAVAV